MQPRGYGLPCRLDALWRPDNLPLVRSRKYADLLPPEEISGCKYAVYKAVAKQGMLRDSRNCWNSQQSDGGQFAHEQWFCTARWVADSKCWERRVSWRKLEKNFLYIVKWLNLHKQKTSILAEISFHCFFLSISLFITNVIHWTWYVTSTNPEPLSFSANKLRKEFL